MWTAELQRTSVIVVPAAAVILLDARRWLVCAGESVDPMALAPGERVAEHLARLLHVEVAGLEETQDVRVLGNLQHMYWWLQLHYHDSAQAQPSDLLCSESPGRVGLTRLCTFPLCVS